MGQQISIWVDNECISAPKVNSVITDGIAIISGDFTEKDSAKLAYLIDPERNKFCFSEKSRNITLPTQKEYNEALANVPWVLKTEDLVYRFDIREKADKIRDTDGNYDESFIDRDSVLQNMKKDDFEEYIRKAVESLAYETNESSIKNFSVDRAIKIIKTNNLRTN